MSKLVVAGAKLACTMGASPCSLTVLPLRSTQGDSNEAATIQDYQPVVNISGFGMCQSPSNPAVAAATAAAMGVLTPQPCVPVIPSAWSPGSPGVTIKYQASLTDDSMCSCNWAGNISISDSGQPGDITTDV